MSVTTQHADFVAKLSQWQKVRDVCAGQDAVKAGKTKYLPRPNPGDSSNEASVRYDNYLLRAVYVNFTGRTLSGLVGLAYAAWPDVEKASALDYLDDNADGAGVSLIGQSQVALAEVLKCGRAGLLVDYPAVDAPVSKAEQSAGKVQATLTLYRAEDVINWRTTKVNGHSVLSLVVISEVVEVADGFKTAAVQKYRVLRLGALDDPDPANVYSVEVWHKPDKGWVIESARVPLNSSGAPWAEIPFRFVGSVNNDTNVDPAPLYDMAELNLAHYRNSADYEESVFLIGQPQLWMAGLTEHWRDHIEKTGVYLGSRSPLLLPESGSAGLLQASPNGLVGQAMRDKETQLAGLGARLLTPGEAVKTAEQSRAETKAAHSVLSLACDNVSEAYSRALVWAGEFMGAESEASFAIGTDFAGLTVDATVITAIVQAMQAGKLPDADGWAVLRKLGLIDADKSDEAIREEIAASGAGLGLDDAGPGLPPPKKTTTIRRNADGSMTASEE